MIRIKINNEIVFADNVHIWKESFLSRVLHKEVFLLVLELGEKNYQVKESITSNFRDLDEIIQEMKVKRSIDLNKQLKKINF